MKRQFAVILLLISILSLSGCHKEPSTPKALVPSIMYNGEIYCSTGKQMPGEVAEDAIIGEITSTVPLWEIEDGVAELKASRAERFTIKELERTKKNLETKLQKLHDAARKDDVVTFEQLGVDRLYVDEAHSFKNLFLYTKMRNVAGLSTTDAQKSSDMLLKCRYIDEITHGKGVTFATGTPVSNSMTELYTMMRYLQHDMLKRNSLTHFDCWASAFGETTTAIELAPEGTGYRARTRFAKFFNLPELMNLFREAADIKTADQLNLPTPTAIYHTEVTQPTALQQQMVQELSERAAKVHSGAIAPTEDNMLKIVRC